MYKNMLYNTSLLIVKNEDDAKDLVQDAFIKAFKNIANLKGDLNLGGWLKRIVINCSLDFLKQKNKLGWLQNIDEFHDNEDEDYQFEDDMLKVEMVKEAINNLKDTYRVIITLYLIEEYTHKEIAKQLGLKENTVRSQYSRGKKLLIAALKKN